MKRAPFSKLPLVLVSMALVMVLSGIAWSQTANPFGTLKGRLIPSGTMFVSKDAPLSFSLSVNPDRILSVRPLLSFGPSKTAIELENFRDSILGLGRLDYNTQVKPWLGDEVTLAVTSLDVDRDSVGGRQPGYLMVLTTKDAAASQAFLTAFWRDRSPAPTLLTSVFTSPLTTEAYEGTEITYGKVKNTLPKTGVLNPDVPFTLASAVVGDRYVLFANSPKVLKNSINQVQAPDLNLQHSEGYTRAIAALNPDRLGQLYLNLPQFMALTGDRRIAQALAQLPETSPVTYTHLALGLKADRSGLIADTVLLSESALPASTLAASASTNTSTNMSTNASTNTRANAKLSSRPVLQYLPANSMAVAIGDDLAKIWDQIGQTVKGYGVLEQLTTRALDPFEAQSQLDLVKDVFQWVKGDYGLALLPPDGKTSIDWVFAVKRSTSPQIQSGLDRLDNVARSRGFTIGPVKTGTKTVQAWTQLSAPKSLDNIQAKAIAAHTTIGDFEVFSTSIETLDDLLNESFSPLSKSSDWQSLIRPIPAINSGYLFFDWETARPLIEQQVPGLRLLELLAQPVVSHFQSVTISSSGLVQDSVAKGTIVVGLK